MRKFILFCLILSFQINFAQQAKFLKINKYQIAVLSDSLQENSGLNFFDGQLFTFNDGGNSSELFQLNLKTGKIEKKISTIFKNIDWEALTNDGEYFYIGDFGNNAGNRTNLKVFKSAVRASSSNSAVQEQEIQFKYPEQTAFNLTNKKTNFDGEAIIFLNGKLHLFTKEWSSNGTTHYTLNPEIFEVQNAEKQEVFKTNFMVTDAAYFENQLYLVGYAKNADVYLQIFTKSEDDLFFTKNSTKYFLGSAFTIGQIEGVAVNEEGIFLSGERFKTAISNIPPKLFFIPEEKLK